MMSFPRTWVRWIFTFWAAIGAAHATEVNVTGDPKVLARELFGPGSNVSPFDGRISAGKNATAIFSNPDDVPLDTKSGIILSTGDAAFAKGWKHNAAPAGPTPGDQSLADLIGGGTYDAATLSYAFNVPEGRTNITVQFAFVSEEAPARAGQGFNDVMAIFVDGVACEVVRTSDARDPLPASNKKKSKAKSSGAANLRAVIRAKSVAVAPGKTHTLKVAIADGGDSRGDSLAFVTIKGMEPPPIFPRYFAASYIPNNPQVVRVPERGNAALLFGLGLAGIFAARALVDYRRFQPRLAVARRAR